MEERRREEERQKKVEAEDVVRVKRLSQMMAEKEKMPPKQAKRGQLLDAEVRCVHRISSACEIDSLRLCHGISLSC